MKHGNHISVVSTVLYFYYAKTMLSVSLSSIRFLSKREKQILNAKLLASLNKEQQQENNREWGGEMGFLPLPFLLNFFLLPS